MWPLQPIEEAVVANFHNETGQVQNQSTPRRSFTEAASGIDSDSETDELNRRNFNCRSVNLLLVKSLQTYAAVQRTTAVRQLRCECSEVFTLRSWEACESRPAFRPDLGLSRIEFPHRYRTRLVSPNNGSFEIITRPDIVFDRHVVLDPYPDPIEEPEPLPLDPCPNPQLRRTLRYVKTMPQPNLIAKQVANRLIKYARYAKNLNEDDMCCLNCGFFPIGPVTGKCGHTRCTKCIKSTSKCPCGEDSIGPFYVNILIRDLVDKTLAISPEPRITKVLSTAPKTAAWANNLSIGMASSTESSVGPIKSKRRNRRYVADSFPAHCRQNLPMSARARYSHALDLLSAGRHKDAAPHLAIAAASLPSEYRVARPLLAQVIMLLCGDRNPRALTKELNLSVRHLSTNNWINKNDLECTLCSDIFSKPVTTPCGHMFCRTCLEKTLDYTKRCPLCLHELSMLKLKEMNDTLFMRGALAAVNALTVPDPMEDDNMVPIFVCTVAYPSVPCPLFIFDPQYWIMIRRVLESGSRCFGMVAMDKNKRYADYGTILEVRDCVHLEDGKSILSTVGLSRFKVIEKCVRDGCEMARIETIRDMPPRDIMSRHELDVYGEELITKAIKWLSKLSSTVLCDIENSFGAFPASQENEDEPWWESQDGPAWLWWLVAVLPLRTEIKILILATDRLLKRMMAVFRTLEAVEEIRLTTVSPDDAKVRIRVGE